LRPRIEFLDQQLLERIVSEARDLLCNLGIEIHSREILGLLSGHGARVESDTRRVFYTQEMIDRSLETVPSGFQLYDVAGEPAVDLSGFNVQFTPGSAAIHILDHDSTESRTPTSADYVRYTRLVSGLDHLASQSTAFIPGDVHEKISDSYRLFLSLLHCPKPVVTGAFTIGAFEVMKDLLVAVRGSEADLAAKPLAMFSCCPTSPLKWSDVTSQNLIDCARYSIPVEIISMPMSGFIAPVTLVGTLVQHTVETLSGLVISQLVNPGTPVLYGGSPAYFDVRYETTPMGAPETQMIDCAYNEIGKYLGIPTQAYIGLSDSKLLDMQAGLESSMGATLAALAGINNISGPGMMDFESCYSHEKLVIDNEICGMTLRLTRGIEEREDFPARPRFEELLREQHLLISDHTMRYLDQEVAYPGPVIDRANRARWQEEGKTTMGQRAHDIVEQIIAAHKPVTYAGHVRKELIQRMRAEAATYGMDRLPEID